MNTSLSLYTYTYTSTTNTPFIILYRSTDITRPTYTNLPLCRYLPYPTYPTLVVKARQGIKRSVPVPIPVPVRFPSITYGLPYTPTRVPCVHVYMYLPTCKAATISYVPSTSYCTVRYLSTLFLFPSHTYSHIPTRTSLPSPLQAKEKKACYYCYCYCFFLLLFQVRALRGISQMFT